MVNVKLAALLTTAVTKTFSLFEQFKQNVFTIFGYSDTFKLKHNMTEIEGYKGKISQEVSEIIKLM